MTAFRLYVVGVDYNPCAPCAVFTMFVYVMCSLLCFRFYFCYLWQFVFIFKWLSLCWYFLQFSLNCSLSGFSTILVFPCCHNRAPQTLWLNNKANVLSYTFWLVVIKATVLSGGSQEESASQLAQIVGRIQFPVVVELKPLPSWLSAESFFCLPDTTHHSWLLDPFLHPESLLSLIRTHFSAWLILLTSPPIFKRPGDYSGLSRLIKDNFPILRPVILLHLWCSFCHFTWDCHRPQNSGMGIFGGGGGGGGIVLILPIGWVLKGTFNSHGFPVHQLMLLFYF